jgi:glutathione S-transferase
VAREAGFDLQLIKVDLATHKTEHGDDYYAINPRGYVPLLELADGSLLREGPVIVQFLADQAPERKLAPADGMARLRLQEWLTYIGTELHKQFYWLFHPAPAETQQAQRQKIGKALAQLEQHLASSTYLLGAQFTVADAYAFTVMSWCKHVGIDLQPYPRLRAYLARVADRPAVQEALRAEGLVKN